MRAICANPAWPLSENDFFRNQTGKLGKLDPVPQRQMLHAWRLKLWHPVKSVQMSFEAPIPDDMKPYVML